MTETMTGHMPAFTLTRAMPNGMPMIIGIPTDRANDAVMMKEKALMGSDTYIMSQAARRDSTTWMMIRLMDPIRSTRSAEIYWERNTAIAPIKASVM